MVALLQLAVLHLLVDSAAARVTGVWTDIESGGDIVGQYLRNATATAHSAHLRFAVDAQVGWSTQRNTVDPTRPVHEQVMDIVDEVVLMDYFTGCDSALSTANVRCDPTMALFWLAPWLTYANFLLKAKNRTVLIDVGVAVGPIRNATTGRPDYPENHWISSELELEIFFQRSWTFIQSMQGDGPTSGDPGMLDPAFKSWCTGDTAKSTVCAHHRGPFHNFAIFMAGQLLCFVALSVASQAVVASAR